MKAFHQCVRQIHLPQPPKLASFSVALAFTAAAPAPPLATLLLPRPAHWHVLASSPPLGATACVTAYAPGSETCSTGTAGAAPTPPSPRHTGWTIIHEHPLHDAYDAAPVSPARHADDSIAVMRAHADMWKHETVLGHFPPQTIGVECSGGATAWSPRCVASGLLLRDNSAEEANGDSPLVVMHVYLAWEGAHACTRMLFQAPAACFRGCWGVAGVPLMQRAVLTAPDSRTGASILEWRLQLPPSWNVLSHVPRPRM